MTRREKLFQNEDFSTHYKKIHYTIFFLIIRKYMTLPVYWPFNEMLGSSFGIVDT